MPVRGEEDFGADKRREIKDKASTVLVRFDVKIGTGWYLGALKIRRPMHFIFGSET
jgi:hypothetical protein